MIASSDISKFESNNHQGIKDRLISKVLNRMTTDERYKQLISPDEDFDIWWKLIVSDKNSALRGASYTNINGLVVNNSCSTASG